MPKIKPPIKRITARPLKTDVGFEYDQKRMAVRSNTTPNSTPPTRPCLDSVP
jgi:hypothetical protein